MRKILVLTDMDTIGSGYRSICAPLFTEIAKMDYDVKIVGLSNRGEEHPYPFSIIPANNVEEGEAIMGNMIQVWQPDILIVALDLPFQARIHSRLAQYGKKYIAITPLENGPLCMSWAAPLFNMDAVFFISELGKQEALKVGVKAEHLMVGVDTESMPIATSDKKKKLRDGLGIPQDAFVVLTVADNQERKNLWAGMASACLLTHDMSYKDLMDVMLGKKKITDFKRNDKVIRYILVTREGSPYGWRLRDLAVKLDINQEYVCFERGLPRNDLWGLYAVSDVYLQPSKAEGLGLPVLDAMCMKIPVVATDTGAMTELLEDKRGFLIPDEYVFVDVWGNSIRMMIDIGITAGTLVGISVMETVNCVDAAYDFIKQRTWDIPARQIDEKIKELVDEQK